jgi:hypothetical protein
MTGLIATTHPHPDCADCTFVTARNADDTGHIAAGIKLCETHKRESDEALAAHRKADPQIDAVHRLVDAYRAKVGAR